MLAAIHRYEEKDYYNNISITISGQNGNHGQVILLDDIVVTVANMNKSVEWVLWINWVWIFDLDVNQIFTAEYRNEDTHHHHRRDVPSSYIKENGEWKLVDSEINEVRNSLRNFPLTTVELCKMHNVSLGYQSPNSCKS